MQYIFIALRGSAYNHLRALSCRHKTGGVAEFLPVFLVGQHSLLYVAHGLVHTVVVFFGRQQFQVFLLGNLYVHTEAVGIEPGFVYQFAAGSRDAFQVDVSVETMYQPQVFGYTHQAFHGVIGVAHYARAEEKPFYVVAAIKLDGEVYQLCHCEGGAGDVIASAVDAIGAIVDAIIGQHHL